MVSSTTTGSGGSSAYEGAVPRRVTPRRAAARPPVNRTRALVRMGLRSRDAMVAERLWQQRPRPRGFGSVDDGRLRHLQLEDEGVVPREPSGLAVVADGEDGLEQGVGARGDDAETGVLDDLVDLLHLAGRLRHALDDDPGAVDPGSGTDRAV